MGQVHSGGLCESDSSDCDNSRGSASMVGRVSSSSAAARTTARDANEERLHNHVRKLSTVSHRAVQLLSMKPKSENEAYAETLNSRRKSSLINLILGVPSSGPRFCDDLCSITSQISEGNFGIEFFPDSYQIGASVSSLRLESIEDVERGTAAAVNQTPSATLDGQRKDSQRRRRSSLGSLVAQAIASLPTDSPSGTASSQGKQDNNGAGDNNGSAEGKDKRSFGEHRLAGKPSRAAKEHLRQLSAANTLASIDLKSSFEIHDRSGAQPFGGQFVRPPLRKAKQTIFESLSLESVDHEDPKSARLAAKIGVARAGLLRRSGSELSLYSTGSANSADSASLASQKRGSTSKRPTSDTLGETKLIIMLQVCLPFMLAGFGNMAAGLTLEKIAHWKAFQQVPSFFVLLPPFVGLKGNIEMTLASRLSTLSNLKLLDSGQQKRRAYLSNLVLILSQAAGLSIFAALTSVFCELALERNLHPNMERLVATVTIVLASAVFTATMLSIISSVVVSLAVCLANVIHVNPDNLSTLIAALYGDVSCVLVYGLSAEWMYSLWEAQQWLIPIGIIVSMAILWPILLYSAHKFKETKSITFSSIPPMLASIIISMGSGAVLSKVVGRFHLIALYQPVVNGFGANLIAVQASRVSTWLWCNALRKLSVRREPTSDLMSKKNSGSLASFVSPSDASKVSVNPMTTGGLEKPVRPNLGRLLARAFKTFFWSFFNSTPNSTAARLLLLMLIPAHTIYFFVIWLLSTSGSVTITWQFYCAYLGLSLIQVTILLTICQPLMTQLMKRHFDPDIFGISLLMALADLTGTLCLAGAFLLLAKIGDPNAAR